FSLQLRYEREKRSWSQEQLAQEVGTTRVNISRWESGITFPNHYYRDQLRKLFNKSPEELGLLLTTDTEENRRGQISSREGESLHSEVMVATTPKFSIQAKPNQFFNSDATLSLSFRAELSHRVLADLRAG